jgi:CBS domain-containing protein
VNARDVMTTEVRTVDATASVKDIAKLLLDAGISAVPVVDARGAPIGMVSEGDLLSRGEREARRDWWLALLAEGTELNADYLAQLRGTGGKAADIMSAPVVTIGEDTEVGEIARLLTTYRIKRVPVVRDGQIVGIVSRADLVRALSGRADAPAPGPRPGLLSGALDGLEHRFEALRGRHPVPAPTPPTVADEAGPTATDFQGLMAAFAHHEDEHRAALRHEARAQRQRQVAFLIDHHVSDPDWRALLHGARQVAEHGEKEFMLLRFPSQLCSDGGRAINITEPDWPATLRGEAAELYLRWHRDLKPRGFHLAARVLDFPGGLPGDIGLFLSWDH